MIREQETALCGLYIRQDRMAAAKPPGRPQTLGLVAHAISPPKGLGGRPQVSRRRARPAKDLVNHSGDSASGAFACLALDPSFQRGTTFSLGPCRVVTESSRRML